MDALGRSTGSSDPTRSRQRAAPPTVPSATRPARGRRGCSSRRCPGSVPLALLSRHHSTAVPSPERYGSRYEVEGRTNFLEPRQREVRLSPVLSELGEVGIIGG